MFFNKKVTPPSEPFKKEKISQQALDNFAQKYIFDKGSMPYVLQSGKQINFCPGSVVESSNGLAHYRYLLGQTAPYHMPNRTHFELKHIAYTLDENNKLVPWCTDPKVLSQFVSIGQKFGYILIEKGENNQLIIERAPNVDPVIHTERTHTDD